MAKFKFTFTRPVSATDTCDRVIEAATYEEAAALADRLASDFNSDCPDDATSDGSEECGSWSVDSMQNAPDNAETDITAADLEAV